MKRGPTNILGIQGLRNYFFDKQVLQLFFSMLITLSKKIFFRYFAEKSLVCPFILSSNGILSQENYLEQNPFSKNKEIPFVLSIFSRKKPGLHLFWTNLPFFAINDNISLQSTYSTITYHISMESRGKLALEKVVKI